MLANLPRNTQTQTLYDGEPELTEQQKIIMELKRLGISSFGHTFENFEITAPVKGAYQTLKTLAEGKSDRKFILLYGKTGCGKTYLIEALIIEWATRTIFSRYRTFSDIVRYLKGGLSTPGLYEQRFSSIRDVSKLIIDDYGMGTTESRFEVSELEDIIDLRYRRRYYPDSKDVTILTSNKDIKELPDRVTSRFYDPEFGVVFYMGDRDYRKRKI